MADFRAALVSSGAAAAGPDCFASRYAGGACPDVEAALERAFGHLDSKKNRFTLPNAQRQAKRKGN